ncbi:hypothetical protein RB213_012325 [Colletotrichum asianum]
MHCYRHSPQTRTYYLSFKEQSKHRRQKRRDKNVQPQTEGAGLLSGSIRIRCLDSCRTCYQGPGESSLALYMLKNPRFEVRDEATLMESIRPSCFS